MSPQEIPGCSLSHFSQPRQLPHQPDMQTSIRKPWAVILVWYVISFVVGIYPYLTLTSPIQPIQLIQLALDAAAIYGLFGYVVRKPIRSMALRLLYLALVLVFVVRIAVVLYFVTPNLHPWEGTREQFVSIFILSGVPFMLLAAVAMWRYATTSQKSNGVEVNQPVVQDV